LPVGAALSRLIRAGAARRGVARE